MATIELDRGQTASKPASSSSLGDLSWNVLHFLGSLKITVVFFALSILLLFVGTLAQDEQTLLDVKRDYFNSWLALVPHHAFLPVTIFGPHSESAIYLPMPGGATIGLVLLINLIAAKLTRFSMQARGAKLVGGVALVALGLGITTFVIVNAHAENGLQGEPPFGERSYDILWWGTVASTWLSALIVGGILIVRRPRAKLDRIALGIAAAAMIGLGVFFLFYRIPDPGLRIVWQLFKSLIAGVIMLIGLNMLFGRRGGNVLIHLAVGLLMLSQFVFGDRQYEDMMLLSPGQTSNMTFRADEVELAFVESLPEGRERHVAIDQRLLRKYAQKPLAVSHNELPFDLRIDRFYVNSDLESAGGDEPNLATKGLGQLAVAAPKEEVGAATQQQNLASAYVTLLDKKTQQPIDTYLISQLFNDRAVLTYGEGESQLETASVDGREYSFGLRLRRSYKPYQVELKDVQAIQYTGTSKASDFSSFVRMHDPQTDASLEGRIWMNNPIRFNGETLYQSRFLSPPLVPVETTGLQIVTNAGWMMPYLACVFAGLGMMVHFGQTFVRFAGRFDRETSTSGETVEHPAQTPAANAKASRELDASAKGSLWGWLVPAFVAAAVVAGLVSAMRVKEPKAGQLNFYAVGQLPMQSEGRYMPLDSVARRFVQTLSGSTSTVIRSNPDATDPRLQEGRRISAVEFLLAVANDDPLAKEAKVFRIDAGELRGLLQLDPQSSGGDDHWLTGKKLRHRYSYNQLEPQIAAFEEQGRRVGRMVTAVADGGQGIDRSKLNFYDSKILELYEKLLQYRAVSNAFLDLPLPQAADAERVQQVLIEVFRDLERLEASSIAKLVPPKEQASDGVNDKPKWMTLSYANFRSRISEAIGQESLSAAATARGVFAAAESGNALELEQAVDKHKRQIAGMVPDLSLERVEFEAWYNGFNPFVQSIVYYSIATVLGLASFLVWRQPLRRTALSIMAIVLIVHTAAIIMRIYISQRPPVVNLYSSAVYIGWAAVLFGLVIEWLYPIRLGLLIGTVVGTLTLLVAWGLDTSDTMPVLEAVLDTQFWLTTHVQCITLGYAATFVAGFIAIYALIHRIVAGLKAPGSLQRLAMVGEQRVLYKLCYGVVCFALFFSFVGTVLGGLWADDSWGRFWGWDPKENGALMIVLWNAILLHARWDKWVGDRGFYLLAIGGNIMTSWSWFGTNQLGIGLHSYGFTKSVLIILAVFVFSQLLMIGIGFLAKAKLAADR